MQKFEIGKTYINKRQCGVYTYIDTLTVEHTTDNKTTIGGLWKSWVVNEHGFKFGEFERRIATKVRKAPNKDYQKTVELLLEFTANTEIN